MINKDRNQILDAIDEWVEASPSSDTQLDDLHCMIRGAADISPPEKTFLEAYVRYMAPHLNGPRPPNDRLARSFLLAARMADTSDLRGRSLLYSGHALYDEARPRLALPCFRAASTENISPYLHLKAVEFAVCSLLILGNYAAALDTMNDYAIDAESASPQDIWPDSLAGVLGTIEEPHRNEFILLAARIDKAGEYGSWLEPATRL